MSEATTVLLCSCGHGARMHERDDDTESGRGACGQRHCGCTVLRERQVRVEPSTPLAAPTPTPDTEVDDDEDGPDLDDDTADAEPPPDPRQPKRTTWTCPECGETFTRPQAMGAHRRYRHGGLTASRVRARPGRVEPPAPEPERVPDLELPVEQRKHYEPLNSPALPLRESALPAKSVIASVGSVRLRCEVNLPGDAGVLQIDAMTRDPQVFAVLVTRLEQVLQECPLP